MKDGGEWEEECWFGLDRDIGGEGCKLRELRGIRFVYQGKQIGDWGGGGLMIVC